MNCARTTGLLQRRRSGLTDAEKLHLEDHLAGCSTCRKTAANLATLCALSDEMALSLPNPTRERIIARALAAGRTAPEPVSHGWAWPAVAVAVAAAVVLAVVTLTPSRNPRQTTVSFEEPAIVARIEPDRLIETQKPATLALAEAEVRFTELSRARWKPRERTIYLERGAVWAKVDATPKRSFRIQTKRFVVQVVGTEFWVDPSGVRVFEGRVKVVDHDGRTIAEIGANESWQIETTEDSASPVDKPAKTKRTRRRTHAALLKKARRALSEGRIDETRKLVSRVTRSKRAARGHRAEAAMLLAECAAKEGNHTKAVRLYLDVAERFDGLPAAETALFAAARGSRGVRAKALLERYLEAYPEGRFAKLAEMHLGASQD